MAYHGRIWGMLVACGISFGVPVKGIERRILFILGGDLEVRMCRIEFNV